MPFIAILAKRHPLVPGDNTIGGGDAVAIPLPEPAAAGVHAVAHLAENGSVTLRPPDAGLSKAAPVMVDGTPLGAPRPLVHGAKIVIAGRTLLFGDLGRIGSTEHVAGVSDDDLAALDALAPGAMSSDRGGRLVSLADGRVVPVPDDGLDIGRDPACDLVLAATDASRWHASIRIGVLGYTLDDTSTNGVLVNGVRVAESRLLVQGDVLRFGAEEFRFEADEAGVIEARVSNEAGAGAVAVPSPVVAPAGPPLLATLEIVNGGVLRGTRLRIHSAAARVGRGQGNEIVLADESVSGRHATLERGESGWVVRDHASTNGTYIDGERVKGERPVASAAEVRFGNVKMVFRVIGGGAGMGGTPVESPGSGETAATRGIVGVSDAMLRRRRA